MKRHLPKQGLPGLHLPEKEDFRASSLLSCQRQVTVADQVDQVRPSTVAAVLFVRRDRRPLKRLSDGFAIARDHGALDELGGGLGPCPEALMEELGIEASQDPPTGVMRGEAMGQVEKSLQLRLFAWPKSSMSRNPPPSTMLVPKATTMMSMRRCFLARSIPGSGKPLKQELIDIPDMHAMALAPLMCHSF